MVEVWKFPQDFANIGAVPVLISVAEAAHLLALSENTVRRHLEAGHLRGLRVGNGPWRVDLEALHKQLNQTTTGATA
jgi:excisionase family DNA binding protein